MAIDYTSIFTDLGQIVSARNHLVTAATDLGAHAVSAGTVFDDDVADVEFLAGLLAAIDTAGDSITSQADRVAKTADTYVEDLLPAQIDSAGQSLDDILDDLSAAMTTDGESVDGNTVGVGAVTGSATNNGTLADLAATQMAVADDIVIRCTNASTQGAERWTIESRYRQKSLTGIVTGVAYPGTADDQLGVGFTITASTQDETVVSNDGASQLANVEITGAVASTNCDANKKLYAKLLGCGVSSLYKPDDTQSQITGLSLAGVTKGTNTDAAGRLYATVYGVNGTTITESNDGGGRLSAWSITGALAGTNISAAGVAYVAVEGTGGTAARDLNNDGSSQITLATSVFYSLVARDGGTTWEQPIPGQVLDAAGDLHISVNADGTDYAVEFYKDSGRAGTDLVGHTETFQAAGIYGVIADNASGLAGSIHVSAPSGDDTGISIHHRLAQVRIYKNSGLAGTDETAATDWEATAAAWSIHQVSASGLSGSVTAGTAALAGTDYDITLTLPLVTINLYKGADGAGTDLVAHVGPRYSSDATGTNADLTADGTSGLSGSISYDFTANQSLIALTLPLYRLELYKAAGLAGTDLVAHVGWTYDDDAAGTDLDLVADNTSGIGGSVDIDYSVDDTDIQIAVAKVFAVGDEFCFPTTCTDSGVFQSFWRDHFEKALPCNTAGSETISDDLAP